METTGTTIGTTTHHTIPGPRGIKRSTIVIEKDMETREIMANLMTEIFIEVNRALRNMIEIVTLHRVRKEKTVAEDTPSIRTPEVQKIVREVEIALQNATPKRDHE